MMVERGMCMVFGGRLCLLLVISLLPFLGGEVEVPFGSGLLSGYVNGGTGAVSVCPHESPASWHCASVSRERGSHSPSVLATRRPGAEPHLGLGLGSQRQPGAAGRYP